MEHQFRRGIYRPNAQRLSISLAPLVAQRSLLFRVKADLAGMQTNYGELTPTEESPGLFALSGTASAKIISAALSAMSTASVWSQDSWKGDSTPFSPILAPVPTPAPVSAQVSAQLPQAVTLRNSDWRRHAVAFSPSVQWENMNIGEDEVKVEKDEEEGDEEGEESDKDSELVVKTPLQSASSAGAAIVLPKEDPSEMASITIPHAEVENAASDIKFKFPSHLKLQDLEGGPAGKLKKKQKSAEDNGVNNKRLSRPARAFGKVMSHLSLQPSKKEKEAAAAARRQTAMGVAEYKLPEFKPGMSSPMRMSFVPNRESMLPPHPAVNVRASVNHAAPVPSPPRQQQQQVPRSTTPPPSSQAGPAPVPAPVPTPMPMPSRKGHRRYNSSPAVPQFSFKGWEADKMPPLPVAVPVPLPAAAPAAAPGAGAGAGAFSRLPTIPGTPAETPISTSIPPSMPMSTSTSVSGHARSRSTTLNIANWERQLTPAPAPSHPHPLLLSQTNMPRGGRTRSRSISTGAGPGPGAINIRAISHPFPVRESR